MTKSRTLLGARLGTAALLGILALTGCGSESGPESEAETGATTEPAEALTAADGSDYAACDDGECEVTVTEPTTFEFDTELGSFGYTVTEVNDADVSIEVFSPGSLATGSGLSGPCEAVITANSVQSGCSSGTDTLPEPEPEPGTMVIQLLAVRDGVALLRIVGG